MSRFSTTYPTGRPTRICAASGRALAVGERYVAALIEHPDAGRLERIDFGLSEWQSGARPAAPLRLIGSWRAVITEGTTKAKPILDDEAMLELVQQIEPGDARRDGLRMVLALMLIRRRILTQDGSRGNIMLLRQRGVEKPPIGPPLIEVVDPGLDEATLTEVMGEMEAMANRDAETPQPTDGGAKP